MERKFYKKFYRTELEVIIGDLAKVVQKLRELVKKYITRFRNKRIKCAILI